MSGRNFSTKEIFVQRGTTASCVAVGAYLNRSSAINERTGKRIDYSPEAQRDAAETSARSRSKDMDLRLPPELKDDLGHAEVLLPVGAPERLRDWSVLWNERERFEDNWADTHYRRTPKNAEKHKAEKAKLSFSGNVSLPREFSIDDSVQAARRFLDEKFVRQGMAVHYAVHVKDGQPHFHYQATSRIVSKDGFGMLAMWSDPNHPGKRKRKREYAIVHLPKRARAEWMRETRSLVADVVNDIAAERGYQIRVEPRSFKDRDISFTPEVPVGPGRSGKRADVNGEIREANAELAMAYPSEIIKEVFANRAVVTEAQLKNAVLDRSTDDASFQAIWRGLHEEGHIRHLGQNVKGQEVYTSAEFDCYERLLSTTSDQLVARNAGLSVEEKSLLNRVISDYETAKTDELKQLGIEKPFKLKPEQRAALEHAASGHGLALIQGLPGTGKTTIMEALRLYNDAQNERSVGTNSPIRTRGAATAAVAAENLEREAGVQSTTVAKILHDYKWADELREKLASSELNGREKARVERQLERAQRSAFRPGDVLIVDEAGMVGTRELAELQQRALQASTDSEGNRIGRGVQLLFVGDHEQISSVSAGSGFRILQERHGAAVLADIQRQNDELDRQASTHMVKGNVEEAVLHYHRKGAIHFAETKEENLKAIIDRYMALRDEGVKGGLILTANRNADVDAMNDMVRQIRRERGELGEEHRVFGRDLAVGDEIVFTENNSQIGLVQGHDKPVGVKNGYYAVVRSITLDGDGKPASVSVEKFNHSGKLDGRMIAISVDDFAKLNHSYATTLHKSQGQTKTAHLHLAGAESRSMGVVSLTRHKDIHEIFADKETYHNDLRDLIREMSADSRQENLLDYAVRPEKRVYWENMYRYQEVYSSYNAEMAKASLRAEAEGIEDIRDTEEWKRAQGYRKERADLARLIVGDESLDQAARDKLWEDHRAFAQQAKVERWTLEEFAGVRERLMSLREQEAIRTVENFARVNRETKDLWKQIVSTHRGNPHEHPEFERFGNLHYIRGREASIIAGDRVTYGMAVNKNSEVTWASICSIAKKHKAEEKVREKEEEKARVERQANEPFVARDSIVAEFVSARWRVDALARLNRMQASAELREQLQEARKEAKELAAELYQSGRQTELSPEDRARFKVYTHNLQVEPKLAEQERVRIQSVRAMEIAVADIAAEEMTKSRVTYDTNTPDGRNAVAVAVAYDFLHGRLDGRIGDIGNRGVSAVSRPWETYQNEAAQSMLDGLDSFSPDKAREHAEKILEATPQAKEVLAEMDRERAEVAEKLAQRFVILDQEAARTPRNVGVGVNFRVHPIHERRMEALQEVRGNRFAFDLVRGRDDVSFEIYNSANDVRIRAANDLAEKAARERAEEAARAHTDLVEAEYDHYKGIWDKQELDAHNNSVQPIEERCEFPAMPPDFGAESQAERQEWYDNLFGDRRTLFQHPEQTHDGQPIDLMEKAPAFNVEEWRKSRLNVVENEGPEQEASSPTQEAATATRTQKLDLPEQWFAENAEPRDLPRYGDGNLTPAMANDPDVRKTEREFYVNQWNAREKAAFPDRDPAPFPEMSAQLAAASDAEARYQWHAAAFRDRGDVIVSRYDELALEAANAPTVDRVEPEKAAPSNEQDRAGEGSTHAPGAGQQIDTKALFEKLSPNTKKLVLGDCENNDRSYQGKVIKGLAKDGLSLEEAKAVAKKQGGPWVEKRQYWNRDRTLEADFDVMWEKWNYEKKYQTERAKFREVDAEQEMSEAVHTWGSRNRKEAVAEQGVANEYSTPEQRWVHREAAAQELGERANVKITPEPVPPNPAEREEERAAELVSKFRGQTITIPVDHGAEEYAQYRSVIEKQEERADRVGDQSNRHNGQKVQGDRAWAAELMRDQELRATAEPRVPPTDLPEHLQKAHAVALDGSKMSFHDYRAITQRARYASSFVGFIQGRDSLNANQSLSFAELKRSAYLYEMKRYDKTLKKAGLTTAERRLLVVRESKLRAAEMGLDYDYARGRLRFGLAKTTRLAAAQEARIDKTVQKIELRRAKLHLVMPKRDLKGLTPKQEAAHAKALAAVNAKPTDLRKLVSEIEYGRAMDMAKGVTPASSKWSKVSLSPQEMKELALHTEMRTYRNVLAKEGLTKEEIDQVTQRETRYRAATLELKEGPALSKALDKTYSVSTRDEHEDRISGLAVSVTNTRDTGISRLEQFDLSPRERAAHDAAIKGVRPMTETELASVIKNHETGIAYARTAEGGDSKEFYREWENSKLGVEDAKRIALTYEVQSYSNNLQLAGVDGWRHETMVNREWSHRAAELGISTVAERDREGRQQGWNVEDSAAREIRMERLASGVSDREPAVEPLDRASRMSDHEVKRLAYRLEDAALDQYSQDHGVNREEARRHVQISGEELKEKVREIEQIRRAELEREKAHDLHRYAEQKEAVQEANAGRAAEDRTLDEKVNRFAQHVAVEKELGMQLYTDPDLQGWHKETRARADEIVKDPAYAERQAEVEQALKARTPEAYDRLKEIQREAELEAQRQKDREQDRQKDVGISR